MPKRNYQVYGLYCVCGCDPNKTIKYVGQASMGAQDRFNKHRYSARNGASWPVSRWMKKHGVENIRYRVLETVDDGDALDEAEARWIVDLGTLIDDGGYNIMPGGNGVRGYKHSPWAKSRIPRAVSQETRDKISATLAGKFSGETASNVKTTRGQAEEVIRRYWAGETRTEIAAIMGMKFSTVSGICSGQSWKYLARPSTPRAIVSTGHFEKGATPHGTKLNPEKVREIRARHGAGETAKTLATEYRVTPENISMIVLRKTWKHVE